MFIMSMTILKREKMFSHLDKINRHWLDVIERIRIVLNGLYSDRYNKKDYQDQEELELLNKSIIRFEENLNKSIIMFEENLNSLLKELEQNSHWPHMDLD